MSPRGRESGVRSRLDGPRLRRTWRRRGRMMVPPAAPLRRRRGFALISVLWILVLLTAIVGEFAYSMRTEVTIARNFKEATQAHYIATAGLIRSVVELSRQISQGAGLGGEPATEEEAVWRINAPIPPQPFGAGEFTVHIDNAAGLIDLNTASEGLLRLLAGMLDTGDRERDILVDSILDWRDSDDLHRLNGAEDDYYRALPNPYPCKNAPFDSVDELLLVRGIRPEMITPAVRAALVVIPEKKGADNGGGGPPRPAAPASSGQINVNAAPQRLLEALPQITPQQVEELLRFRAGGDFRSVEEVRALVGARTFSAISPYLTLELSPYYWIRAEGGVSGSSVRQNVLALVRIDKTLPLAYEIVAWQEQYY